MRADHGLFDDPFRRTHARDMRPHPIMEAQFLDPTSWVWRRGDIYLRLYQDELRYCAGDRLLRMYDATLPQSVRDQARRELRALRISVRRYFRRTARRPGRPPKLTPEQRKGMSEEHDRLRNFVRQVTRQDSPSRDTLDRLFRDREFLRALWQAFPRHVDAEPAVWNRFLRDSQACPLSKRCLYYLAYRYGVSVETIRDAIW